MSRSDAVLVDARGRRAAYAGPELLEGLPPVVLEGLARRRLVALGQPCPCGARLRIPNRAARRKARRAGAVGLSVDVLHEPDCPAISDALEGYLWARGWSA